MMLGAAGSAAVAVSAMVAAVAFSTGDLIGNAPFGWLGTILLAVVSSFAAWRAGSERAWKATASARGERIEDLTEEIASCKAEVIEMRAEIAIPERLEGIIRLMSDTAVHQEEAASQRLEDAMVVLKQQHVENVEVARETTAAMAGLQAETSKVLAYLTRGDRP